MRLNTDPIQLARQVRSIKDALLGQTEPGADNSKQDKITGRVGYQVFPPFMVVLAGEIRRETDPSLLMGAVAELVGSILATTMTTMVEDRAQYSGLNELAKAAALVAVQKIAEAQQPAGIAPTTETQQ